MSDNTTNIDTVDYGTVIVRTKDNSYVIQKSGMPCHIPSIQSFILNDNMSEEEATNKFNSEWKTEYDNITSYLLSNEDKIEYEYPPADPTFEELKVNKKFQIESWRKSAISSGTVWNGYSIDTDEDAQRMAMGLILTAQVGAQLNQTWDPNTTWRLKDGSFITLPTSAEATALAITLSSYVQGCYNKESLLKTQVDNATNATQLDTIVW